MKEMLELLQGAPIVVIAIAAMGYFLKVFIERRIEGLARGVEDIRKTSLNVKADMRGEEREQLLTFRVAVEKWEYFLQTLAFDFSMLPASQAKIETLYKEDKEIYLEVRIAVVKASTYLRDEELERQLTAAVEKVRKTYYPLISEVMSRLIDLQAKLLPIEIKLKQYQDSGLAKPVFAPTAKDREEHLALQQSMTSEMSQFAEKLLKDYPAIAQQMADLKQEINRYIYRPIRTGEVEKG